MKINWKIKKTGEWNAKNGPPSLSIQFTLLSLQRIIALLSYTKIPMNILIQSAHCQRSYFRKMIAIFGVLCLFVSKGDKSTVKRYTRIPNEDFLFQLNTISYWSCDWCACAEVQLIFHYGSIADKVYVACINATAGQDGFVSCCFASYITQCHFGTAVCSIIYQNSMVKYLGMILEI